MARPKKYTDRWIKKTAGKLLQYARTAPLPLKQDFASINRFSSQRLSEFARVSKEFSDALKRFEDIQQKKIIGAAMLGKINTTFAIFTLKNVAGWRDAYNHEHTGKGGDALPTPIVNVYVSKNDSNRPLHSPESITHTRGTEQAV